MHPFLDHPAPLPIAHRGGSLEAEENTAEAFAHAVTLGYRHIETDVRATADGVVVVHHDPTFARMFGDPRAVADLTWDQVSRLRTKGGAQVPRLSDVLRDFPDTFFNIESKDDAGVAPLSDLLRPHLDRVCVGSFDARRTAGLRERLGDGLCWSPAKAGVAQVWAAGWGLPLPRPAFPVLQVPMRWKGIPVVTPRFIRAAARHGIPVQVWTVDDRSEMEALIALGIGGIMTDRPALLREVLRARGLWRG